MKIKKRKLEIANLLTIIGTAISLLMTIVYATQYAASFDKRVTLLEQHDIEAQEKLNDFKANNNETNDDQDKQQQQFQNDVKEKLNHLDDKIESLYQILISYKHKN